MKRTVGAFIIFLALAGAYTWPLLPLAAVRVASDAGDPVLNASILWWNATTLPFSPAWWNPPFYYLTHGVSTFTENLVGISVFASPIFWLTQNALTTYNLAFYLAWPLSALSVFLLVKFLTKRDDAAFIAGIAFAFSPYRMAEMAHVQMLWSWGLALSLLALHRYLEDRRFRWLVLFGAAWLEQSLANGYMMVFGGLFIALWLVFFCAARARWRAGATMLAAWAVASLPLVPVMMTYRAVHEYYGLRRDTSLVGLSTQLSGWFQSPGIVWWWSKVLPNGAYELFPGVTALALIAAAFLIVRPRPISAVIWSTPRLRQVRTALIVAGAAGLAGTLYLAFIGPIRFDVAGVTIRMTTAGRAQLLFSGAVAILVGMSTSVRSIIARRSATVFYLLMIVVAAILSCGPVFRLSDRLSIGAPYAWLLHLPGFDQFRVPTRFWMIGILGLAVSAGFAFARLPLTRPRLRVTVFALVVCGLLVDGWLKEMPMAEPPQLWPIEAGNGNRPLIEIPLGPDWDAAATYRSIWHGRGVVNGVSGYDPAHYDPLQAGLNAHDPMMLPAIASFGTFDVVLNGAADPDHEWMQYVSSTPGIRRIASDGTRTVYNVPAMAIMRPDPVGDAWPIVAASASNRANPRLMADGRLDTHWSDEQQRPGQWVSVDLGTVRDVGGVTHALGEFARDFPRLLAIDLSVDGVTWEQVWKGPTVAIAFRAAVVGPRQAAMRFTFPPRSARYVRLRQLAAHKNMWRVAELNVHAPRRR